MQTIGLTGGIGSGKSVISKILTSLNYPVFNSDLEAKRILVNDDLAIKEMKQTFGDQVYMSNGALDRTYLSNLIFSNSEARIKMNAIVHPKVRKAFESYCAKQQSSLVFNEAAILFETGSYKNFDLNILVTAPEALRIARVIERDGVEESVVKARIAAQWTDEEKSKLADYTIINDGKESVIQQLEEILNEIT